MPAFVRPSATGAARRPGGTVRPAGLVGCSSRGRAGTPVIPRPAGRGAPWRPRRRRRAGRAAPGPRTRRRARRSRRARAPGRRAQPSSAQRSAPALGPPASSRAIRASRREGRRVHVAPEPAQPHRQLARRPLGARAGARPRAAAGRVVEAGVGRPGHPAPLGQRRRRPAAAAAARRSAARDPSRARGARRRRRHRGAARRAPAPGEGQVWVSGDATVGEHRARVVPASSQVPRSSAGAPGRRAARPSHSGTSHCTVSGRLRSRTFSAASRRRCSTSRCDELRSSGGVLACRTVAGRARARRGAGRGARGRPTSSATTMSTTRAGPRGRRPDPVGDRAGSREALAGRHQVVVLHRQERLDEQRVPENRRRRVPGTARGPSTSMAVAACSTARSRLPWYHSNTPATGVRRRRRRGRPPPGARRWPGGTPRSPRRADWSGRVRARAARTARRARRRPPAARAPGPW